MDPHEVMSRIMGIDKNKEIFTLWYEVTYLRNLLTYILQLNPSIGSCINEGLINTAREEAKNTVSQRFPNIPMDFNQDKDDEMPF